MSTFMCQKSFHPASQANQKARFIAEKKAQTRKEQEEQRKKQLEQEKNELQNSGKRADVGFMYKPPPGYMAAMAKKKEVEEAGPAVPEDLPHLKNAPTEGEYTKDIKVTHKPFAVETRFVRCLRCGKRGHQAGERDCPLAGMDPNDDKNKQSEDPIKLMNMASEEDHTQGKLVMREELTQIHHGPVHMKGKYDIIGSDDEEEFDAGELVDQLDKKQRKRLLKFMKKRKKEEKKRQRKERKKKEKEKEQEQQWVEAPSSCDDDSSNHSGSKRRRDDDDYSDSKRRRYNDDEDNRRRSSHYDRSYHRGSNANHRNSDYEDRRHYRR